MAAESFAGGEYDELYDLAVADPENTLGGIRDDTDPDHPSVIGHMVKSLMPGQDLTRVTIPSFFLEPRSLLERMSDLFMHPDLLLAASKEADPLARMMGVLKWYLSGWHYKTISVKKPYNPIVGETFAAYWKHEDGSRSQYFAEQVLHRPPISAIYFENRPAGVSVTAHIWTKSQFSAPQTTKSILDGAGLLTFAGWGGEEYFITLPTYFAHNLLLGTMRMELGDSAAIVCKATGLRADVDFTQRGMFSSAGLNGIEAHVSRGKEVVATVSGTWDGKLTVESAKVKSTFLDIPTLPISPKWVLPVEEQGPWESRRLWAAATEELRRRPDVDWNMVDREKLQLEEEQRLLACHAYKTGAPGFVEWVTKRFHMSKVHDPLSGKEREIFTYDGWAEGKRPYEAGQPITNMLALSRSLPDPRGGRKGAGAVEGDVALTRSIKLSAKRQADFAAQDGSRAPAREGGAP